MFDKCAKKYVDLEDEATSAEVDRPVAEKTLRVRIDEIPYDLRKKIDLISILGTENAHEVRPYPRSFQKCCN